MNITELFTGFTAAGLVIFLPLAAILFDGMIGDPRSSSHPVVLIGRLIAAGEKFLLRPKASPLVKQTCGALLVVGVLGITYGLTWYICLFFNSLEPWADWLSQAVLLSFVISPRSLAESGLEIKMLLERHKIKEARHKLSWIVGRDTEKLTTPEITRATVETVAENIVDGIISPLFYAVIGGLPLAFLYRAVNTLDSMIGYKNEKYSDFGKVAARLDDVFNYIPARLTGLLLFIAVFLLHENSQESWRILRRDASRHPSPNSGIPESIVAGALNVQLGGTNYYGGVLSERATMGDPVKVLQPMHIAHTIRIMYVTTAAFAVGYAVIAFFIRCYFAG